MTDLSAAIDRVLPSVRADLEDLIRIPSVSYEAARAGDVQRSAEATAALFEAEGFTVKIVQAGGAPRGDRAPTRPRPGSRQSCCTRTTTSSRPATPTCGPRRRSSRPDAGDRLYARGAADDKAGLAAHLAAFRAHGGNLPVGVTVFVEGEEESGRRACCSFSTSTATS